jgi:cation:H+ antiporter
MVLVALDAFGVRGRCPLSYRAASLAPVLEGVLVMAILTVTVMGTQLPPWLIFARVEPSSLLIAVLCVVGIRLIGKACTSLTWQGQGKASGAQEEPRGIARTKKRQGAQDKGVSIARTATIFALSATVALVAGVVLATSGDNIAGQIGMNGVLFGSTFLAAPTALPEVSTGLRSVRLGDNELSVSDIFGGNVFQCYSSWRVCSLVWPRCRRPTIAHHT